MLRQTELTAILDFSTQRPHRGRFLRWIRFYPWIVGILITGIVVLSTISYAPLWAMLSLLLYWLYRWSIVRIVNHLHYNVQILTPVFQLRRAIILIGGVTIFLFYLYKYTSYGQAPDQNDTLWLLYLLAILIVSKYGTMWQVAVTTTAAASLFVIIRLTTMPTWTLSLIQSIGSQIGWLGLLAFVLHVLIRFIRDRSADTTLVHSIQQTLTSMRAIDSEDAMLQMVVDRIAADFSYPYVNIFLIASSDDLLCRAGASAGGRRLVQEQFQLRSQHGIIGRVAYTGQTMFVPDVRQNSFYVEHKDAFPDTLSELCVPICINSKVVGVLDAQNHIINGFHEQDQKVMETMADSIGQALDNLRLLKALEQVRCLIDGISRRFLSHQELDSILDEIVMVARDSLRADVVVLYERDPVTNNIIVGACTGALHDSEHFSATVTRTNHLVHRLLQAKESSFFHSDTETASQESLFQNDYTEEKCLERSFVEREGIRSRAIIRLQTELDSVGIMFLNYRTRREFDSQEQESYFIFADLAALAIQKAQAQRQQRLFERENLAWLVHDQSKKDALTTLDLASDLLACEQLEPQMRQRLEIIQTCIQRMYNDFAFIQGTLEEIPAETLDREVERIMQCVTEAYDISFETYWEGDSSRIPPLVVYHLRLMMNEAVMNAVRHGKATDIRFACSVQDHQIDMQISDNGRGFDPDLIHPHGLIHIRERARRMGGICTITSAPDSGTTILVQVPLCPT